MGQFLSAFLQELVPPAPDPVAALPFMTTRMRLWQNLLAVSRMTPEQLETAPHKIVAPKDCELPGPELITAYLGGAVATHVRIGNPLFSHVLFPVYLGICG